MDANSLPDRHHVEKIRDHLWCGREPGRAAVMVGAGFSRNADKAAPRAPDFLLWTSLGRAMFDELYPSGSSLARDREELMTLKTTGLAVLKLASEYENRFGAPALDDLLQKSIPDNGYQPGKVHKLLLELPWSDVFTTNYDTLLERTRHSVHERKYEVICTPADLPCCMRPRIVKLHGSFPSTRPFIITDEQYRRYPRDFAPFVNTVQQSLMEGVLCMVGFSGDDPNFLSWAGWVRDNLGNNCPPIYLCGLLDLSPSERSLLESRKIVPVDLSPLFPRERYSIPAERHKMAMEWLLLSFHSGRPPRASDWPEPPVSGGPVASPGVPALLSSVSVAGESEEYRQDSKITREYLETLLAGWTHDRRNYPGWVVCPRQNRQRLLNRTGGLRGIEKLFAALEKLEPPENLLFAYELNWRLEKALVPLFINWVGHIEAVLGMFNPFPSVLNETRASISRDNAEHDGLDWQRISEAWVQLVLGVAREAREDQDADRFYRWMNLIEDAVTRVPAWNARWHYENALFYVSRLDGKRLRETLTSWPDIVDNPFWNAKRAAMLAELGEIKEARGIAESALVKVRSWSLGSGDRYYLSQEAWVMYLVGLIAFSEKLEHPKKRPGFAGRWDELAQYNCSPWAELDHLKALLAGTEPTFVPQQTRNSGFDPGKVTVTRHFSVGFSAAHALPAFAFLRLAEEAGLPIRCGMASLADETLVSASRWIEAFAPLWAMASTMRNGNAKKCDEWLDRTRVATLAADNVEHVFEVCIEATTQGAACVASHPQCVDAAQGHMPLRSLEVGAEFLSRVAFRLDAEKLGRMFDLGLDMYSSRAMQKVRPFGDLIGRHFRRLLFAMSPEGIRPRLADLLRLPIPGDGSCEPVDPSSWPEPVGFLDHLNPDELKGPIPDFEEAVRCLLGLASSDREEVRKRAFLRLFFANKLVGLSLEQRSAFASALWSKTDDAGLPSNTGFFRSSLLRLPSPQPEETKEMVRRYILDYNVPCREADAAIESQALSFPLRLPSMDHLEEFARSTTPILPWDREAAGDLIEWNGDEVVRLVVMLSGHWDYDKPIIRKALKGNVLCDLGGEVVAWFSKWHMALVELLPKLAGALEDTRAVIRRVIKDIADVGVCTVSCEPGLLLLEPERTDMQKEAASKILTALSSSKREVILRAIDGIYVWLGYHASGLLGVPPGELLGELINRLVARRQPLLDLVAMRLTTLVKPELNLVDEAGLKAICTGLGYLAQDTELPPGIERYSEAVATSPIPYAERPNYRMLAARLAHGVYLRHESEGRPVPDSVRRWESICEQSSLPEVRRAWE